MDNQGNDAVFHGPFPADADTSTVTISREELDGLITAAIARRDSRPSGPRRPDRRYPSWIPGVVVSLALVIVLVVLFWPSSGPGWPPSVATVKTDVTTACLNLNVASEPSQVNFACNPSTDQVLWVFSLLTSNNNPSFVDSQDGRVGLEPISASEGGQIASWLNLHHPYNPFNPIDSLQVAARAINSIIGGATTTNANGTSAVVPGLEGNPANCLRYTGSAALTSRSGYPALCARPVSTVAGQTALVGDVFQKLEAGATPAQGLSAAVLFEYSNDPGNSQVQAILQKLAGNAVT